MLQRIKHWNDISGFTDIEKVGGAQLPYHAVVCRLTENGLKVELDTTDFKYEKELITVNDDAVWHTVVALDFPEEINGSFYFAVYIINNGLTFDRFLEAFNKSSDSEWFAPAGLNRGVLKGGINSPEATVARLYDNEPNPS